MPNAKPNVILVFADQMRLQSLGYAGDPDAITPRIDALAAESLNFMTAVSGCPVCSPARASLLTGQYPDRHGVFLNDVYLKESPDAMGHVFKNAGYETGYIGKWHVDGHGDRYGVIPPERRQGFDYWKVMECTHRYLKSPYYDNDNTEMTFWDGYDATAQTADACEYIRNHSSENPFCMVLSWGPPHTPCCPPQIPGPNVPEEYLDMFDKENVTLRKNVPADAEEWARGDIRDYLAHYKALDDCMGMLLDTVDEQNLREDTVVVFWSDHGDMLGSQGQRKKQRPWDESILVPLLIRYPRMFGNEGRIIDAPINSPDIYPTILSICGIPIPTSVDGLDYLPFIQGAAGQPAEGALIGCYHPFGQFERRNGGVEYRGIRTDRYTYVKTLEGPWLLYDNKNDPFQLENLVGTDKMSHLQKELDEKLNTLLDQYNDEFLAGDDYVERWGYKVNEHGTMGTGCNYDYEKYGDGGEVTSYQ